MFRRALERGNLLVAEATAREVGRLDLREALKLTALIARSDRERGRRAAVRWLQRWLDEEPRALDEVALVVAALTELGGRYHPEAVAMLRRSCTAEAAETGKVSRG